MPALLAALAAAAAGCQTVFDDDTFMHLAFGREMIRQGWWLKGEPFLYTVAPDQWSPENYQSWGMQLVFYAAHALGGIAGIVCLQMALVGAAAFLFALYASRRGADVWLAGMTALLMSSLASFFLVQRPLLITPVLAGSLLLCLRLITPFRLVAAVFLQVLWANLHASFVLGFFIFAARWLEEIWPSLAEYKRTKIFPSINLAARMLTCAALLAPVFCLLNPSGWHLYRYVYELNKFKSPPLIINDW
ncbi:MAG: hypothetical protein N3A66_01125, partial [Planctomycetota bacterium]|nr:hypothetical protein [Planctomycetota bacterium]